MESIDEPVTLLGHSYGGNIALEVSLLDVSLNGLILYEPGIPVGDHEMSDPSVITRMNDLLWQGNNEEALVVFLREVGQLTSAEIRMFRNDPSWEDRVAGAHTLPREERAISEHKLSTERFSSMTTPTLLLSGGDSPPKFTDAIDAIHEVLPDSRIFTFDGEQHVAMQNKPEEFTEVVVSFVREVSR